VSLTRLRRIAVRAQALDGSESNVLDVVRRLGFLQMDPIATVATPQHLVLYSRLGSYDVAELDRLLWQERKLFEWNAFIWPVEDLPLVRARMTHHWRKTHPWTREFLAEHARFRRYLMRELERNGPMLSRDLKADLLPEAEPHRWWGTRQVRLMLEILTQRGEVAVAGRVGKQRLERGKLHAHPEISDEPVGNRVTFLSPFDRLVHDRARAEALWGFFYRLEMYVPKAKRQYGYYVLPILRGERILGRIDVERARATNELVVNGVWWEDGQKPVELGPALKRLAAWVGATPPTSVPTG
jgi:uncharacterized protein YcaQ